MNKSHVFVFDLSLPNSFKRLRAELQATSKQVQAVHRQNTVCYGNV
jgi:hypothetical protein